MSTAKTNKAQTAVSLSAGALAGSAHCGLLARVSCAPLLYRTVLAPKNDNHVTVLLFGLRS